MTAEIAILNKTAVALATDSAVTISSGNQALKIFESADKLFELSTQQPLGVMVYNGMQFLGVPLEEVVKSFRRQGLEFDTVQDAATAFLAHLYGYVDEAPDQEIESSVRSIVGPIAQEIGKKIESSVLNLFREGKLPAEQEDLAQAVSEATERVLSEYEALVADMKPANFIPRKNGKPEKTKYKKIVLDCVYATLPRTEEQQVKRIAEICTGVLKSDYISGGRTGIVFAGFGEKERFPTLFSYEIDGVHEAKIRYVQTAHCDIDRAGPRAYVRPFAQKDMVDRFLHGLDDGLRNDITEYCRKTIGKISQGIFDSIIIEDEAEQVRLKGLAKEAEETFTRNLNDEAFDAFQNKSKREIEDMVEFMPKPELARMAEALIDLTSIKRKVSQGMETVGGPVDVAVISKNEGFVWVKRKHYFPAEINNRYFARNRTKKTGGEKG